MPNFKPKNVKQIVVNPKTTVTLNSKHSEMLAKFQNNEDVVIPNYESEISNLEERLLNESLNINQQQDIKERINKLNRKIKSLQKQKKEYYLQNSQFIFDYFEKKKNE